MLFAVLLLCEYLTSISISEAKVEGGSDVLNDASELSIDIELEGGGEEKIGNLGLVPWTHRDYKVENVEKALSWLNDSYIVSEKEPLRAFVEVTYNGRSGDFGTIKKKQEIEFEKEGLISITADDYILFKLDVKINKFAVSEINSAEIKTPAAVVLQNNGDKYKACFSRGDNKCSSVPMLLTKVHRQGMKYVPEGTFVYGSYGEDEQFYTQYSVDTEVKEESFFPVIDGMADVLVSIKSAIKMTDGDNGDDDGKEVGRSVSLNIYENYSTQEAFHDYLLIYSKSLESNFVSLKPSDDVRVLSQIGKSTRETLALDKERASIIIAVNSVAEGLSAGNHVSIPISRIARYDTGGRESVIRIGKYEIRYTAIPVEAVYAIIRDAGSVNFSRAACGTSIHASTNNITIPPTPLFSSSHSFSQTGVAEKTHIDMTAKDNPFSGITLVELVIVFGGIVILILVIVVITLFCCLRGKRKSSCDMDESIKEIREGGIINGENSEEVDEPTGKNDVDEI